MFTLLYQVAMQDGNFNNFVKFYNENKDKLHMSKKTNYPINYKKGKQWATAQCDPDSRSFANDIIKFTTYISFGDFMERLTRVCESYLKSNQKDENTHYVLIVPFKISKSNMWVSLLAFEHLKHLVDDIAYDITDVYNQTLNHKSKLYDKVIKCLICDDCAYTGHQLGYIASFDNDVINYPNKPPAPNVNDKKWLEWHETINKDANSYIKKIDIRKFSVDVIIPYMSILAKTKLLDIPYVKIPKACKIFPIFNQQINVGTIPVHVLNEYKQTFQYHKDISAIYFDHKIADVVSTFHRIYLLAPLFNCSVQDKSMGFIDHCTRNKMPENIKIYDYHIDLEKLVDNACPPTFYKGINYTFNKKPVDSEIFVFDLFAH
jgi:hypothetical protein